MKYKICVTNKDIDRGAPKSVWQCPIAIALKRKFAKFTPSVSEVEFSLWFKGDQEFYSLPRKAEKFIQDFDNGKKVKPFSFCVNLKED